MSTRNGFICRVLRHHAIRQPINPNRNDFWQPYLRITNSYNKTFALKFSLGFCRSICSNGVIFGKKGIDFVFMHSKRGFDSQIQFQSQVSKEFETLEKQFQSALARLQGFPVERKYVWPLFCKAFDFAIMDCIESNKCRMEGIPSSHDDRFKALSILTDQYYGELGANGYSVVNIFTDYASRPPETAPQLQINGLQRKCGAWISDFSGLIEDRDFRIESYLEDYLSLAS